MEEAEEIAAYLAQHQVLQRVNSSLNAAVRSRAPNPLLFMAQTLRGTLAAEQEQPVAPQLLASVAGPAITSEPVAISAVTSSASPESVSAAALVITSAPAAIDAAAATEVFTPLGVVAESHAPSQLDKAQSATAGRDADDALRIPVSSEAALAQV